jgi:hypothetical protein
MSQDLIEFKARRQRCDLSSRINIPNPILTGLTSPTHTEDCCRYPDLLMSLGETSGPFTRFEGVRSTSKHEDNGWEDNWGDDGQV